MRIQLSDHFTYGKLLRFVLPSVAMMVFISIYSVVDGLFVSNFVGKTSFAAINLIMPILSILSAMGLMIGAGGTAIVGKTLGEHKRELANQYFSMLILAVAVVGVFFAAVGFLLMRPMAMALGAEGAMLADCVLYGRVDHLSAALPDAADVLPELFCHGGKAQIGACRNRHVRRGQYAVRRAVCCGVPMGTVRGRFRNRLSARPWEPPSLWPILPAITIACCA